MAEPTKAAPLQAVATAATALGNGDLTRRCDIQGDDSLGAIAQAINQMAGTLRKLIDDLGTLGNDVDSDSRTIQHAFGDVRERFASQQAETGRIVGILEDMRGKGEEVVATASQVTDSTQRAVEVARNGTSVVDETIRGMGVIERTVSRASDEVFQLGQRSDEIGAMPSMPPSRQRAPGSRVADSPWSPTKCANWRKKRAAPPRKSAR